MALALNIRSSKYQQNSQCRQEERCSRHFSSVDLSSHKMHGYPNLLSRFPSGPRKLNQLADRRPAFQSPVHEVAGSRRVVATTTAFHLAASETPHLSDNRATVLRPFPNHRDRHRYQELNRRSTLVQQQQVEMPTKSDCRPRRSAEASLPTAPGVRRLQTRSSPWYRQSSPCDRRVVGRLQGHSLCDCQCPGSGRQTTKAPMVIIKELMSL